MPIDPSIPLQVQRFKAPDQMAQLGQLMQLKQAQGANALQDFQMKQAMQADAEKTQYKNALQGAVGPDGAIDYNALKAAAVGNGDVGTAMSVDRNIASTNALKTQQETAQLEKAGKLIDLHSRMVSGVTDEPSFQAFRQKTAQLFGPNSLAGVPETYDPNWVKQELQQGLTYKDQLAAQAEKAKVDETNRHNLQMEGIGRDRIANSGPMALITSPDGTVTALGGPNGVGQNAMGALATAKGKVKEGEEQGKAVGKYFGEQYSGLLKASDQTFSDDANFDRLNSLLKNVDTGKFKGATTELKKAAKSAGIDLESMGITDDVAPVEAARALSNAMALQLRNPAGGAGMPGAMSDADRTFLQSMVPGIETTPDGRALIVQTHKQINQRVRDVAKMATQYRKEHGALDEGFAQSLQDFSAQNPIFHAVTNDADFEKVPSGQFFMAPDGSVRKKP